MTDKEYQWMMDVANKSLERAINYLISPMKLFSAGSRMTFPRISKGFFLPRKEIDFIPGWEKDKPAA